MKVAASLSAVSAGLYFAVCQVGYFFHTEFMLSSTFVSYYAVIGMWLLGALVGLFLRSKGLGGALLLGGLAAYYLHWVILMRFPFDLRVLPVILLLVFCSALYSGYFFRMARDRFPSAAPLFFHENNGFLLGYAIAVAQLLTHGQGMQLLLPAVAAVGHVALQYGLPKAQNLVQSKPEIASG